MKRRAISDLPQELHFRPRHNGCQGSNRTPLRTYRGGQGVCPECQGLVGIRSDGVVRKHVRQDGFHGR